MWSLPQTSALIYKAAPASNFRQISQYNFHPHAEMKLYRIGDIPGCCFRKLIRTYSQPFFLNPFWSVYKLGHQANHIHHSTPSNVVSGSRATLAFGRFKPLSPRWFLLKFLRFPSTHTNSHNAIPQQLSEQSRLIVLVFSKQVYYCKCVQIDRRSSRESKAAPLLTCFLLGLEF